MFGIFTDKNGVSVFGSNSAMKTDITTKRRQLKAFKFAYSYIQIS